MSGGYFDHKQFSIQCIIEEQEEILNNLDSNDYVDDKEKFREVLIESIKSLKKSYIFTQRIDWFLSGDDGEDTFYKRLEKDFTKEK